MKKNILLSFGLLCACSLSACGTLWGDNQTPETEYVFTDEEEAAVIDATVNPYNKCGVNGISCNDTALINYTRTEADYRAYGERTKRDHLYTQAAAGNNLTATVRPGIEKDVVTAPLPTTSKFITTPKSSAALGSKAAPRSKAARQYAANDGDFRQTTITDVAPAPVYTRSKENPVRHADNVKPKKITTTTVKEGEPVYEIVCANDDCTETKKIKKTTANDGSVYEIICTEECDDVFDANDDSDIRSEFTEESFDIADYIKANGDDDDIEFTEIGSKDTITNEIDIKEVKISDNTILTWEAEEGDNLRELLTRWSALAGWKLLWNTNRNYILNASVMFKGNFADVSSALIRAFARARPAPIATYYKGNRVIVVETMENENAY